MTRIAKLYQKLLDGRPLSFAEFQRLLAAFGFELDRIIGGHHIYKRAGFADRVNIQPMGKAAKPTKSANFRYSRRIRPFPG